jgi:hypothetical protein
MRRGGRCEEGEDEKRGKMRRGGRCEEGEDEKRGKMRRELVRIELWERMRKLGEEVEGMNL